MSHRFELRGIDVGRDPGAMTDAERQAAELRAAVWLELGAVPGEAPFDTAIRLAVALGARADGALELRLQGPVRALDGEPGAANASRR